MNKNKRVRVRAIVFVEDKIMSMYRENNNRIYYTIPGGGLENNETEQECVIRELREEFGVVIKPIKKVYRYESTKSIEYFYLCDWVSGEFGTGTGEEFDKNNPHGVYKTVLISIKDIPTLPLMPPEIATQLYADYKQNGKTLRNNIATFYTENF